ncbi:MAG: GntR family transcriptional regulator [Chitinivibrionales bacterium]|nr:GntR family transcriptional regulator [Chitinivibrionales bacterium]
MTQRATPALERALAFVETLRRRHPQPGDRLPTLASLARDAGVSLHTMHLAVRRLADRGLLSVRRRAGILWQNPTIAVELPSRTHTPAVRPRRGDLLVREIETELLSGALPTPLPSMKELRGRYRAGYQTVRDALRVMAERGIIMRRGREWVMRRVEHRTGTAEIVLIAPSPDMTRLAHQGAKVAEFCAAMERECSLQGTRLRFASSFHPVAPDASHLGYLVVATHSPDTVAKIASGLRSGGRPVVVVDILGDCPLPRLARGARVPIVRIQEATVAARQAALHLRELGHRRVAFVSPYKPGGTGWVGDRMQGVRDVYGGDVVELWCDDLLSPEGTRSWVERSLMPTLKRATATLCADIREKTCMVGEDWLRAELAPSISSRYTESHLQPLFQRAAADPSITAWIGANDDVALSALRYLARERIDVPAQVSVIGFDGTREGLLARLSTFDFNIPAFVRTALELVLRPRAPRNARPAAVIDIPGVLVMRETSGVHHAEGPSE